MAWSKQVTLPLAPLTPNQSPNFLHSPSPSLRTLSFPSLSPPSSSLCSFLIFQTKTPLPPPKIKQICRAAEYQFPDPIPDFAESETERFKNHLVKRLIKKDIFGDSIGEVVGICTEIFSTFLHTEYGGPGTLLVVPFIDMADTINERGLPGGPQAARSAVVWAQKHVDNDWKEWTGQGNEV
ncbi:hypothetical protein GIB67_000565 [Kingdonia uniflora]|uniref:Uncharacterized protein n=1 Tax=Kingdonia uniflora TaxID=39325 RepID=A0A7J7MIK6_9MAGN|nr:hypothetical protein GIB67_000565 [Kingdonia uniflora]